MKCVFPLNWPSGQGESPHRHTYNPAGCKTTLAGALDRIDRALNGLGFSKVEVSANVPTGKAGSFLSQEAAGSPGVVVRFSFSGVDYAIGQDAWSRVHQNAWSLALMCEGLRQMVRHAGAAMFDKMMTGKFAALPPPGKAVAPAQPPWRQVLKFSEHFGKAGSDIVADEAIEIVQARYRNLAREAGVDGALAVLNIARDQALAELKTS